MANSTQAEKAKHYQQIKRWLSLAHMGLTLLILTCLWISGLSILFRTWAEAWSPWRWGSVALYFVLFTLCFFVFDLPYSWYSSFKIEHRFALSNQTLKGWFGNSAKKWLLSFVIALVLIEGLYLLIDHAPHRWWFWAWLGWLLFSIGLGKLMPVLIIPLFYKYSPLKDDTLRRRILALAEQHGLQAQNVYSLNLSKTTKKANAMFCGMGKTRRIVLSDTLIEHFTPDEIEVVMAHEVGHYKKKHLWRGIALNSVMSLAIFWLAFRLLGVMAVAGGLSGAHDLAAFPLICLVFVVSNFLLAPLSNGYSRRMEFQADAFAVAQTANKSAFTSLMQKLADLNLADPSPHPFIEWFFYDHPSIARRIQYAQQYVIPA